MQTLRALLDKIPHWMFIGLALVAGAFAQNLKDQPDFLSAIFTWNTANIVADLKMAGGFALAAFLGWLKTNPWNEAANKAAAAAAAKVAVVLGALFLFGGTSACITSSPTVPVTPANQAQIASCQSTASLHNGVVIGDMVVGGGATTLGAVAAALPGDQVQTRTNLAITTAALAGVTTVGAGIAALTASNFSNGHCSEVVAPLPMKPAPQGQRILPRFSELPEGDVL
jgi:hypothetical protein